MQPRSALLALTLETCMRALWSMLDQVPEVLKQRDPRAHGAPAHCQIALVPGAAHPLAVQADFVDAPWSCLGSKGACEEPGSTA